MSDALPSERGRPLVIAHRGASADRPENTLSAYALAVEQGADMIEIDLHRTRDAAIVITHDEELDGIGGRGEIAEATRDEVRALDAGQGERVPLLAEVLDRFGPQVPFNLELKRARAGLYPGLEDAALAAVVERDLLSRTLFSSFFDPVLRALREASAGARLALLLSPRAPERPIERALELGAEAVNPHVVMADADLVESAHAARLAVYVYTVDDEADMTRLLDLGVDGLFTNRPAAMRRLLATRGVKPASSA